MSALRSVLAELKRQCPKRHNLICWLINTRPREPSEQHQRALEETIAWLAERMPEQIAVPDARRWAEWEDERDVAIAQFGEAIADELITAWRRAFEVLEDEWSDDEDMADDPDAPPAPAPLAVIPPRKSGGRVSPHPFRGTPQHRDAREEWRTGMGRRRTDEPYILDWAYGEGGDEGSHGAVVEETGRTGAPVGRPPVGTREPARAESVILEHCPGYTIEQLRACLAPGKPTAGAKELRDRLDIAIFRIFEKRSATSEALAAALGCSVKTIQRRRNAGRDSCAQQAAA